MKTQVQGARWPVPRQTISAWPQRSPSVQAAPEDVLRREAEVVLHSWAKEILSETPHDGILVTFDVDADVDPEQMGADGESTSPDAAEYVQD